MLKLSEIGKLSKQFANTCCYKNLHSHILASRKCCPISSSISAAKNANEPIRIKQRAGLCQLGRNDIRCCTKCNEINQCIWSASKNSSFYVPDQATPWYEKQRYSRLNRHTLLEQCQCYGISAFVPPEECLRLRARECMKPLDPTKFKRISPEFLNLLQNYEHLMATYEPMHDRSGYCKRPAQVFVEPSSKAAKARSQIEDKNVRYATLSGTKTSARSKTPQDTPEPLSGGRPKAHGFERPAGVPSEEKVQNAKTSSVKAKDSKKPTPKNESGKTAIKSSESVASATAGTSKAAKQGKNEKKRWFLKTFSKEDEESKSKKSESKSAKNSSVRELWSKPNAAEMRESGGSIEVYRGKSKHREVGDINNDTYDEADTSLIKLRPQVRYHTYTTSNEPSEQSRGRRGKFLAERTSSKYRSVSDRKATDTLVDTKPRVHGIFDDTDTLPEKKRSSPKTSNCKKLWSSRSASSEREQLTKQRSHSLHRKASVTELNPTVHGFGQYRDVGRYRSSPPKPKRKQSPSPSKCRIASDRDDDSDVSLAPRVHKLRNFKHTHKAYATSCKRLASPPPPIKSCKRSATKKETTASLAPRVHAYKANQRNTKLIRERSLSTAAESSSCGRRQNTRTYHTQAVRTRSPLSTSRGRAQKKAISTSASTDSLAPRLHGYRLQQTSCSQREKYSYSAPRNQHEARKHRKSPSNSDSVASIGPPEILGYRHDQPKNRVSLLEPPHKKSLRYEASPMKIKPEHTSSVSKFKSAVYLRPGLHGYRNHALAVDEDATAKKSAKDKHSQLPSTSAQNQQELSQQQPYSAATMEQTKRKPPKHTTIAAFMAHVQYNPDKNDIFYECNKSNSALSINSPHRSYGSSSPLTSDSSRRFYPKLKTCMSRNILKTRCSNCQAQKQHCLCDPSKNDPRFQQLQKIHHHQDFPPEKSCDLENSKSTKYIQSSSILRKCFPAQAAQSDTGLSSECEERCIRFSDTSHNISKQSCAEKEQATACPLPIKPETHTQCGYMSELPKFNGDRWPNGQMEPDGSKSSQECDQECMRKKNALKNSPRGDTSPNAKRHENCYGDSINWSYADEKFPSRYRLPGEKAAEEAYQLELHKARNRSKSRICSPSSEEEDADRVSINRHKACTKDAYDWSEATKNYPIRYQQAAQDAADERAWRQKHMKKMRSMSHCSSQAEERHAMCSRDAYDWSEVTENYPMRYQETAARQEADRVMLERHTARRRSKSPNPQPGVCQERHNACFNDSTDWRNATTNYPIRYRIAALEAATGRKFHTRQNLWEPKRDHSSSPNSSPGRSPNRNVAPANRQRLRSPTGSPTNRSRTSSPSRKEDNAADSYRPQIHGQNYQDIPPGTKRSRSPQNRAEPERADFLRRRYPTRYQTQQQQCISHDKSPANSDDNEPPQQRFKVTAGGYYKSPSYLSDPSKSRIPIAVKYSPLKQSNSSQKEADIKMRTEPNAGKENKPTKRKLKEESICAAFRPDYILGQRQTFRG